MTLQTVTLLELKSIDAVRTLGTAQLYGFFQGYYPGEQLPQGARRCQEKILDAIRRTGDAQLL